MSSLPKTAPKKSAKELLLALTPERRAQVALELKRRLEQRKRQERKASA